LLVIHQHTRILTCTHYYGCQAIQRRKRNAKPTRGRTSLKPSN